MKYYLGIDGGGTKTVAAIGDENGKLLLKQVGKTINFYSVGMENARKNLAALIAEIEAAIGIDKFEAVFIGCSALDAEADDELVGKLCGGIVNARKIKMDSDVFIALSSLPEAQHPCVAICGTGSMAIAMAEDGKTRIAGGWGHIIGDEGSGYAIAVNALRRCCVQCDKGEVTPLLESAEKFFGVPDFRKAIDIIYSENTTKDKIAAFAYQTGLLAQDGDGEAVEIITGEAVAFAETVCTLLEKVKCCDCLGLYGGVFRNSELFCRIFIEKIRTEYPALEIKSIDIPPEESALMLARNL